MSLSQVLGWSPPGNEDYVDLNVDVNSPSSRRQTPSFQDPQPTAESVEHQCTQDIENLNLVSSDSKVALVPDAGKPREAINKRRDPDWVARPRNEFILFRCDYVRKHSREEKGVNRIFGQEAEKTTLSKQAAEAWHRLAPEERQYWKERAMGERTEHARKYPDYRYRPKRNAAPGRTSFRSLSSQAVLPPSSLRKATVEDILVIPDHQRGRHPYVGHPPKSGSEAFIGERRSASVPRTALIAPQSLRAASHPRSFSPDHRGATFSAGTAHHFYFSTQLQSSPSLFETPTNKIMQDSPFPSECLPARPAGLTSTSGSPLVNWSNSPHQRPSPLILPLANHEPTEGGSDPVVPQPGVHAWLQSLPSPSSACSDSPAEFFSEATFMQQEVGEVTPINLASLLPHHQPAYLPNLLNFDLGSTGSANARLSGAPAPNSETLFEMDTHDFFNSGF